MSTGTGRTTTTTQTPLKKKPSNTSKRKGYFVITDVHHNRADPKVLRAMEKADAKTLRDIAKRFRGPHTALLTGRKRKNS